MISPNWLFGLFGNRRVIGCKESDTAWYGDNMPVSPERLLTDKRLDVVLYQPFFVAQEAGIVDTLNTWGRPMNPDTLLPAPVFVYAQPIMNDGTHDSAPLRIGAVARSMAADAMRDIRTLRVQRN